MEFKNVIKTVGTGPKGNRELSEEEVVFVINSILDRSFTESQIGAFLIAWRARYESDNELRFALRTLKNFVNSPLKVEESIEIGYQSDGKNRNPYLFLHSAHYIKDTKLYISYDESTPVKFGYTLKDLKKSIELPDNVILQDREEYLPQLSNLRSLRVDIAMRTIFNTIEKLLNPIGSKYAIIGLHHTPYIQKYKKLYEGMYERLTIVKGDEGGPEISKSTQIVTIDRDGKEYEERIELEEFGLKSVESKNILEKSEYLSRQNQPTTDYVRISKLNAALLLVASKKYNSVKEAFFSL